MLSGLVVQVKGEMIIAPAGNINLALRGFQDDPVTIDNAAQGQGRLQPGLGKGLGQAGRGFGLYGKE